MSTVFKSELREHFGADSIVDNSLLHCLDPSEYRTFGDVLAAERRIDLIGRMIESQAADIDKYTMSKGSSMNAEIVGLVESMKYHLSVNQLRNLYHAATEMHEFEPWKFLSNNEPMAVTVFGNT
jgi:hypothetical protein